MQAIIDSRYEAKDLSSAGLIFVEDYCYYMWWLAAAQSANPPEISPAVYITKVSVSLLEQLLASLRSQTQATYYCLIQGYQTIVSRQPG